MTLNPLLHKFITISLSSIFITFCCYQPIYATEYSHTSTLSASGNTVDEAYDAYIKAVNSHVDSLTLSLSDNVDFNQLWKKIITTLDGHTRSYDDFNQESVNATGTTSQVLLSMKYYTSPSEEQALDQIATNFAATLNGMSDFQKIKAVHDYICRTITYDDATAVGFRESRSAYDGLVKGSTVCCGYALAFQKIMDKLGIPCRILCGDSPEGPHAWNAVYLDGQWYHLDATWDDQEDEIIYDFFLLGQEDLPFKYAYSDMDFDLALFSYPLYF